MYYAELLLVGLIWGCTYAMMALGLTLGLLLGGIAMLPPLIFGPRILEWLTPTAVADTTLRMLDLMFWPAVVVGVLAGLATLYHVGVPWKTPWRRDVPGAVLAMVARLDRFISRLPSPSSRMMRWSGMPIARPSACDEACPIAPTLTKFFGSGSVRCH